MTEIERAIENIMNCENCLHREVCIDRAVSGGTKGLADKCKNRKDESHFIELPCKVGTPFWWIDVSIEPNERGKWVTRKRIKASTFCYAVLDWIDTPIYLTPEEAERTLKEAKKDV